MLTLSTWPRCSREPRHCHLHILCEQKRTITNQMNAKVRMHLAWIISVKNELTSKLQSRMHTVSLGFEVLS